MQSSSIIVLRNASASHASPFDALRCQPLILSSPSASTFRITSMRVRCQTPFEHLIVFIREFAAPLCKSAGFFEIVRVLRCFLHWAARDTSSCGKGFGATATLVYIRGSPFAYRYLNISALCLHGASFPAYVNFLSDRESTETVMKP